MITGDVRKRCSGRHSGIKTGQVERYHSDQKQWFRDGQAKVAPSPVMATIIGDVA